MIRGYNQTIKLTCPHCNGISQFIGTDKGNYCSFKKNRHLYYVCTNCGGGILTIRSNNSIPNEPDFSTFKYHHSHAELLHYFPQLGEWKNKTNINIITNEEVKKDFIEATQCYNSGYYNASMVMSRRAIHQEMIAIGLEKRYPNNLYKQIEDSGIGDNLKKLLHKVKNFGNSGAHPDFCLYDNKGEETSDEKLFAELALEFLDKYFSDAYEIDHLIKKAPSSEKEING